MDSITGKEFGVMPSMMSLCVSSLYHLHVTNCHRYGGSSSVVKGCVILDLHRMNQIVEVNEEYAYAIVEPGVSFFDLYEEIQRRGLNLWPSVPAIAWGSVLGNTMDRGFGYTPNGEHSQSQCGMEVVLPDGEVLRTGMGAMKDSKTFALYKGCVHSSLARLGASMIY